MVWFDVVSWGVVWCGSGAFVLRSGVMWCGGCRLVAVVWCRLVLCDLVVYCGVVGVLGVAWCRGCNVV